MSTETTPGENVSYDILIKQKIDISKEYDEIGKKLEAVNNYISAFYPNGRPSEKAIETVEEPVHKKIKSSITKKSKQKSISIPNKVLNALSIVGIGKTKEVADKMVEIYDEYKSNPKKALTDARLYISSLKTSGKIAVVEEGLGNSGSTYRIAS